MAELADASDSKSDGNTVWVQVPPSVLILRMNIFVIDNDPVLAAIGLCDKHIPKMLLESAQILSTVSGKLGGPTPYKPTHEHHPCVIWAAQTYENWFWLAMHAMALCREYTFRFGKVHASQAIIVEMVHKGSIPETGSMTPFIQAMPEQYHKQDAVDAYRSYYLGEKAKFAKWKHGRQSPEWWDKIKVCKKLETVV